MTTTKTTKQDMDIRDIASAVRDGIKAATKAGTLPAFKVSVRISRYSGGRSLRVEVTDVPAGYLIPNLDNAMWHVEHPETWIGGAPYGVRDRLSIEAQKHLDIIKAIVDEFHWDESDIQADYFSCNFYRHVEFGECESEQRKALEASLREAAACKVLRAG